MTTDEIIKNIRESFEELAKKYGRVKAVKFIEHELEKFEHKAE